jgi:hypothetical protein
MQFNSNHGCLSKATTNSWPTAPVDPISATFNIFANGGHVINNRFIEINVKYSIYQLCGKPSNKECCKSSDDKLQRRQ